MKKLTRREFLKMLGIAGAGVAASQIPLKETPPDSPSAMMERAGGAILDGWTKAIRPTLCTHSPNTGRPTDADALPTYRIYDNETGAVILAGTMTRLGNGLYTVGNDCGIRIKDGKSYTIYMSANVEGSRGTANEKIIA